MVALDHAAPAAGIARQPGMALGLEVARHHRIADAELRRHLHLVHPRAAAGTRDRLDLRRLQAGARALGRRGLTARQFRLVDHAALDQHALQAVQRALVVACREERGWRHPFARVASHVAVVAAMEGTGHAQREHPTVPVLVEHAVFLLDHQRAHAVHAAHVVDAVHAPPSGRFAVPTPTIESRVTSAASASSLQPSVAAGRSGTTR